MSNLNQNIQEAKAQLDAHAVEIVKWHFSPETGCPFWLEWAKESGWNPAEDITCFDDIITPIFKQLFCISQSTRQLTKARDLLLPRLMKRILGLKTVFN